MCCSWPSFSCQHLLSCRHLCIVVSALFLYSVLLYLLLLSQTSKEAQLFRCCVPLPSSVRGMITSCITRRPQSLILAARVSFFTCRRSLSAFVYTLESVNITKNCKKYWQHFLCCIILFVFSFQICSIHASTASLRSFAAHHFQIWKVSLISQE